MIWNTKMHYVFQIGVIIYWENLPWRLIVYKEIILPIYYLKYITS